MAKAKASAQADAGKMVEVVASQGDLTTVATDLLVVDAFEGVESFGGVTKAVDEASGGALARILAAGDFKGKFKESVMVHPVSGPAKRVLLVGLGPVDKLTLDKVRRVSAVVARRARDLGVREAHSVLHGVGGAKLAPRDVAEAMAEGALLGLYKFDAYKGVKKSAKDEKPKLARIVILDKRAPAARQAAEGAAVGSILAQATNQCRDWAQWSGDDAAPALYGDRVLALAREHGLKAEVLGKKEMEKLGMGGVLAVARGSVREPRFCVLEHDPPGAKRTVVLVGKGITFDSGGISIKPADGMENMRMDKSGASAVMGAVVAAKRLGLPLRVVAIAPFTDNLPSGSAYKPGDVVKTMNGKTIEIVNTDAEGRVILSDALHHAGSYKPDAIVELSTLTGGCIIAVGHHAIAGMGNNADLLDALRAAGQDVNERVWPMPFFEEYGEMIKSSVADVKNSSGRIASSVTAGKFLEHFVGEKPWVHLDIASTAYHEGASPRFNEEYCPEKSTGVGVRLLVRWMRDFKAPRRAKA
jgi:leucyl aminopeptidase